MTQLESILHAVTRPARYTGGEWNSIAKDWESTLIKVALVYPDVYEIGMSNMAVPILYDLLNRQPDVLAERAYAPWVDMAGAMRRTGMPLFALESRRPLREFDIIGFSLGYELTYTNVLNMLDLAGIPLLATHRDDSHPLVIAGGSCALNPEPMADFFDLYVVGDGEEVTLEMLQHFRDGKRGNTRIGRAEMLRRLATIPGIYVPGFYGVDYNTDGTVRNIAPTVPGASPAIARRIVGKLPPPVTRPVVPYIETVHDRGAIEIQRGCSHGCRFCHAGIVYRPVRIRSQEEILQAAGQIVSNCGYSELSLVSLSTSDYPRLDDLVARLTHRYPDLAISLPSLHIDSFSLDLLDALPQGKRTALTFAPEAGSDRMRRSINKGVSEEKLLEIAAMAFERGWTGIKLYFMIGLPGETIDDVGEIVNLVEKVRCQGGRTKGKTPQIRVTLSTFVPKPHTPFQWADLETEAGMSAKHELLRRGLNRKGVRLSWHDPRISQLEAALSRGDRRLGKAILRAWQLGCVFDSWGENLNYEAWERAFQQTGVDPDFYARRPRSLDETLPWSHISSGVSMAFLKREHQRALEGRETRDCRTESCNACGLEQSRPECQEKLQGEN